MKSFIVVPGTVMFSTFCNYVNNFVPSSTTLATYSYGIRVLHFIVATWSSSMV